MKIKYKILILLLAVILLAGFLMLMIMSNKTSKPISAHIDGTTIDQNYKESLETKLMLLGLKALSHATDGDNSSDNNTETWATTNPNIILKTSISSDGHYALTTNLNDVAILWDINAKTYHVVSQHAINYSAAFIKHSADFMWQDDRNFNIHIRSVDGKTNLQFNSTKKMFNLMTSDLKHYYSSDCGYHIYSGLGITPHIIKNERLKDLFCLAIDKMMNLSLSEDNHYLLSAGYSTENDKFPILAEANMLHGSTLDGVVLWDTKTDKPIMKYPATSMGTFAAISPDNKYIVSGDILNANFFWDTQSGKKLFKFDDVYIGKQLKIANRHAWIDSGFLLPPADLTAQTNGFSGAVTYSFNFIDATHFLRFMTYVPYAILYEVNNRKPIKYLALGNNPDVMPDNLLRNESIDTSFQQHILVVPQRNAAGINVYRYDPNHQTLSLIWAADGLHPQ